MKNIVKKLSHIIFLVYMATSCQSKEEKPVNKDDNLKETQSLYFGKWFLVNKEEDTYYHCSDGNWYFDINKNKIYDHTPMEDSNFSIDHVKYKENKTFFYIDKQEFSYYTLTWVDKSKGIISYQFNNYEPNLLISEKRINSIESRSCEPKPKSCTLDNLSAQYSFIWKATAYSNEKDQEYPISALIIIKNKQNGKEQEIYFEPNSWTSYKDLPCNELVVRDFNFDGLEDIAIVWDEGGNAGKIYEYYFQDKNGAFSLVESFPLQHGMLAEEFDAADKTITTRSIVGCCHTNINTYKLNPNGSWESLSEQKEIKQNK